MRLNPLSCQILYLDSVSIIVSRFTSFTENYVIFCYQVTSIFCSRYGFARAFSAMSPGYPWPSCRCRSFGPSGGEYEYCVCPTPLFLAALKLIHEKNSRVRPNDLENLYTVSLSLFLFVFLVSSSSCDGLTRTVLLVFSLLDDAGCNFGITASCGTDVGDVGAAELEELVDKPSTTIGTKFSVLHFIRLPSLMSCGFWPLVQWKLYPWSSQSFPNERKAGVSSRSFAITNKSNSLTYTVASSFVCTSRRWLQQPSDFWRPLRFPIRQSSGLSCSTCALMLQNLQHILFPPVFYYGWCWVRRR